MKLSLFACLAVAAFAIAACGDKKDQGPGGPAPSPTNAPAADGGSSSSTSTTQDTSGTITSDGGVKGDAGYFAGGSRLPQ